MPPRKRATIWPGHADLEQDTHDIGPFQPALACPLKPVQMRIDNSGQLQLPRITDAQIGRNRSSPYQQFLIINN